MLEKPLPNSNRRRFQGLAIVWLALASCRPSAAGPQPTAVGSPVPQLVVKPASASGVVADSFLGAWRVSWRGHCVGHVAESIPQVDIVPPAECLADTAIEERAIVDRRQRLRDERAEVVLSAPGLWAELETCWATRTAGQCLEDLLPLEGQAQKQHPEAAGWLEARDAQPVVDEASRHAHCMMVDEVPPTLSFRCTGSLVEQACKSAETTATFGRPGEIRCSSKGDALIISTDIGPRPNEDCLERTREALQTDKNRFAAARRAAIEACVQDLREYRDDVDSELQDGDSLDDEHFLPEASTSLVHALLRKQRELFGAMSLPQVCNDESSACPISAGGEVIGQVIASECGFSVWSYAERSTSGVGDGSWGETAGRALLRMADGAPLAPPSSSTGDACGPTAALDRDCRYGNLFRRAEASLGNGPLVEADLLVRICTSLGGSATSCDRYVHGGSRQEATPEEWSRVQAIFSRHFSDRFAELERAHEQRRKGLRLDEVLGEELRQSCDPLLVDACTGDMGEVCRVTRSSDFPSECRGRRLPDGRCEMYRFFRLPTLGRKSERAASGTR